MQQSRSEIGKLGEELTAYYLKRSGYEILRRNFRIKGGEIDIIASKDRRRAGRTVPPWGLYLDRVYFNEIDLKEEEQ